MQSARGHRQGRGGGPGKKLAADPRRRLAYRLAYGSGILDVEAWRDTIPPEVFDHWEAFERVEGEPWARIAEILKLGFATLANCWGAKLEPDFFEPQKANRAPTVSGPAQAERMLRAAYGG